jgi:NADPH2:quinone reductase
MRAAVYERTGPAGEVLSVQDIPTPQPGRGEVRVRIYASGVNPADVKKRGGWSGPSRVDVGIAVPGDDGAGVIDAVGAGADRAIGERVWVYGARLQSPLGTAAEYAVVPSERAVSLPDDVTFADGASLGIPAMTAHRALFWDGTIPGQTIVVTGGAGSVGLFAVQLAKRAGATVIATVSTDQKAAWAWRAGADYVVNYRTDDVAAAVRDCTNGTGVDRVVDVDLGANLAASRASLKPHGTIAAYGSDSVPNVCLPFYSSDGPGMTIHFVVVSAMPLAAKAEAVTCITDLLHRGLVSIVGAEFAFDHVASAHDAVEQGAVIGKTILKIGDPSERTPPARVTTGSSRTTCRHGTAGSGAR